MKKKDQWEGKSGGGAGESRRDLALKESVFTVTGKSRIQNRKLSAVSFVTSRRSW